MKFFVGMAMVRSKWGAARPTLISDGLDVWWSGSGWAWLSRLLLELGSGWVWVLAVPDMPFSAVFVLTLYIILFFGVPKFHILTGRRSDVLHVVGSKQIILFSYFNIKNSTTNKPDPAVTFMEWGWFHGPYNPSWVRSGMWRCKCQLGQTQTWTWPDPLPSLVTWCMTFANNVVLIGQDKTQSNQVNDILDFRGETNEANGFNISRMNMERMFCGWESRDDH